MKQWRQGFQFEAALAGPLAGAGVVLHLLASGDDVVVLASLVAVGRIDELEVGAFVRQRVVGKGAAELDVCRPGGGGSEWFHKMGEIKQGAGAGAKRGNRREDSRDRSRRGDRLGRWRGRR